MNKLQSTMKFEAARLSQSIQDKKRYIASFPPGELKSYISGHHKKRYVVTTSFDGSKTSRERQYLSQRETALAEQLAIKGLLQSEIMDEERELKAINRYLKYCSSFDMTEKYLDSSDDINQLVSKFKCQRLEALSEHTNEWLSRRCGVSAGNEHQLRVKSHAGFNVRSKSERDILHALMDYDIPYKYEERIITDIGPLFPDFTILNPLNGQELIWEHNGSMDDPDYAYKVFKRTAAYYRKGFHPGKNFIITYEENNEGIDRDWIESIIKQYFTNPYI